MAHLGLVFLECPAELKSSFVTLTFAIIGLELKQQDLRRAHGTATTIGYQMSIAQLSSHHKGLKNRIEAHQNMQPSSSTRKIAKSMCLKAQEILTKKLLDLVA